MIRPRIPAAAFCRRLPLVGLLGAFLPFAHGQTAPAASAAATTPKTDAVVLSPFEVSTDQDKGYAAGNTLTGGRADTPLKITPNSVSVMTKEFLDDFAITDINEAAGYTIGMDPPQGGESGPFGGNRFQASFRGGDSGANFPQRDGALQYFVADSYNSERFEFSRGPATAMFGDGGPGGLQGSSSKQGRFNSTATSLSFRGDSYGGYRATLDVNYGKDRWALRLNILDQNTKAYQDGTGNKQKAISVAATYKLAESTQFRMELEKSAEHNIQYRKTYADQQSIWNRTTFNDNNTAISGPAAFGLGQISATNDYLIYNFGTHSLLNYKGNQYQTVGLGYQIPWGGRSDIPNFVSGMSKHFFLGPADSIADRDFNAHSFFIEHRFSPDWFLQLAWIVSDGDPVQRNIQGGTPGDYRIDVNRLLPTGAANPNFGKAYSDTGGQDLQYQQDDVNEYRITNTYKFDVPKLWDLKQRLSLNTGWRQGFYEMAEHTVRWANNPAQANVQNGVNSIRYRIYYDNPRPSIAAVLPPPDAGYTFKDVLGSAGSQARRSRTLTYGQLISQTTFFNEKLALTGSFRRDKVVLNSRVGVSFDADLQPVVGYGGVAGATGRRQVYQNSKSAGAVLYPFSDRFRLLSPIGVVWNYSTNFAQIANSTSTLLSGEQPPLSQSVTHDLGLRYSMGQGTVYMTVSHYDTKQLNVTSGFGSAADFRNIYLNLGYPNDGAIIGPNGFNGIQDFGSRGLEGWEVELTANPSRNVTFNINYAHPITTTISNSEQRRAFFAANQAEYEAGAAAQPGQVLNGKTILDPVAIATAIQNIENSFNGFTPGTLGNTERHRINFTGRYAFTEGMLKGFAVNLGVQYRGYKKVGSRDARIKFQTTAPTQQQTNEAAYDYLWVQPTFTVAAGANYTRRFGRYSARFQVNVTNLLDDKGPNWSSYSVINAGQLTGQSSTSALTVAGSNSRMQVHSGFQQPDPKKITFTTTLSF